MGWLSEEVERTLASWINANNIDAAFDRPDWNIAADALTWRRGTMDGEQLNNRSIRDLLDLIEGPPEHVLYVYITEWKMQHPLSCRMNGLIHCQIPPPPDLRPGKYIIQEDGTWLSSDSS